MKKCLRDEYRAEGISDEKNAKFVVETQPNTFLFRRRGYGDGRSFRQT